MIEIAHLLKLADEYQRAAGVSDTTLSFRIFKDSKKLAALRSGSDITTGRFNDALHYLSANWPDGAAWPNDVQRPQVAA